MVPTSGCAGNSGPAKQWFAGATEEDNSCGSSSSSSTNICPKDAWSWCSCPINNAAGSSRAAADCCSAAAAADAATEERCS